MHTCHYNPITTEVLKEFASGFPKSSSPSEFQLFEEAGENVFGTFNVLVSDKLLATIPSFISYVSLGRKIDPVSQELRPHLAILARCPTKTIEFGKFISEGSMHVTPLKAFQQQSTSPLIKDGWNCLFLIENESNSHATLTRHVIGDKTIVAFIFSGTHAESIRN